MGHGAEAVAVAVAEAAAGVAGGVGNGGGSGIGAAGLHQPGIAPRARRYIRSVQVKGNLSL